MNVNPITMAGRTFISQLDLKLLSFVDGIVTLLCVCACVLSHFCHVWLFVTIWTVSCQVLLPVWFSRQEYWNGVPCLLQGIFLTQALNPHFIYFLHWPAGSLPQAPLGKPSIYFIVLFKWSFQENKIIYWQIPIYYNFHFNILSHYHFWDIST